MQAWAADIARLMGADSMPASSNPDGILQTHSKPAGPADGLLVDTQTKQVGAGSPGEGLAILTPAVRRASKWPATCRGQQARQGHSCRACLVGHASSWAASR